MTDSLFYSTLSFLLPIRKQDNPNLYAAAFDRFSRFGPVVVGLDSDDLVGTRWVSDARVDCVTATAHSGGSFQMVKLWADLAHFAFGRH
eukprot:787241-Pyramimonas_sp.AAC.1